MNIKTLLYTFGSIIFVLLAIGTFSLHEKGYRVMFSPLSIVAPSTLTITPLKVGDILLIKDEPRPLSITNGSATISLAPGEYDIVVARPGAFPYRKVLTLKSKSAATLTPLLLPTTPAARILAEDEESRALERVMRERKAPTQENPRRVVPQPEEPGAAITLHVEDTSIIATWTGAAASAPQPFCTPDCVTSFTVTTINTPIRNVEFYPGRNDVAIFSAEGNVYAIELDKSPIQNFQPIFMGGAIETPFITVPDRQGLFVIGTSSIFSMELPL